MNKAPPLFYKNLEYIREILHMTQEQYLSAYPEHPIGSEYNNIYDWRDLTAYRKLKGVLAVSKGTYSNYKNGITYPDEKTKQKLVDNINAIRPRHSLLRLCYRIDFNSQELFEEDLKEFIGERAKPDYEANTGRH